MKILLLTQLFQPEPNHLKGLTFTKRLIDAGHEVEVLTCFPNYPGGKIYSGYKLRPFQREILQGVPVTRVALYPSHDNSAFRRFLTYVSFALSASILGPFLFRRFDVVHVCQGATTLALPGIILAWRTHARLVLDVQDIWPESVTSSGMLHNPFLISILERWASMTYKRADQIIVLSKGYKEALCARGAVSSKVHVIYNWMDESTLDEGSAIPEYLLQLRREGKSIVLFAGTMGRVQALEAVLEAAEILDATIPEIHIVFVGAGTDVDRLKNIVSEMGLSNVSFFPRVDSSAMNGIFRGTDALLIHLRRDFLGRIGVPQKTQAYLAAGKPIVIAIDGEAAEIVKLAKAGIACDPEDAGSIAAAIRQLFAMSREERQSMEEHGREYYRENMSFDKGVARVLEVYMSALDSHTIENKTKVVSDPPILSHTEEYRTCGETHGICTSVVRDSVPR